MQPPSFLRNPAKQKQKIAFCWHLLKILSSLAFAFVLEMCHEKFRATLPVDAKLLASCRLRQILVVVTNWWALVLLPNQPNVGLGVEGGRGS